MSILQVHQIPVLNDNYVYLAHCPASGATAVVDPAVSGPVLAEAEFLGQGPAKEVLVFSMVLVLCIRANR